MYSFSKKILTTLLITLISISGFAHGNEIEETHNPQIYASFMYHFAKFTKWEGANKSKAGVVIGYYGKAVPAPFKALNGKATPKGVIKVIAISSASQANGCHIVFLPAAKLGQTGTVAGAVSNTLIVTEKPNNNADISFVTVNNKMKFQLREANTKKRKMVVSENLKKLAILK